MALTYKLQKGSLLLAEPFMNDPNFKRTVVLLTEYSEEEGSVGFVLSRPLPMRLNEVLEGMGSFNARLNYGGPVQNDTLHYVHTMGDILEGSHEVQDGIYWGGNFEALKAMIQAGTVKKEEILFFLGYSGWSAGQLEDEMSEKSWIVFNELNDKMLFSNSRPEELWKQVLKTMGGDYAQMVNYPEDPRLN